MDILTPRSAWKILAAGKSHALILFHENIWKSTEDNVQFPGYHQQHVRRSSLIEYFEYIMKHDAYRRINPTYQKVPRPAPVKGTKRYRKEQKKAARAKRYQEICRVNELLKELSQ